MSSKNLDTRNRILQAAWELLLQNHGKGVRMSDIAKQTGISRQALYLHFSTRTDLLVATTRYLDEVNGSDQRLAASRNAATGRERLDEFIEAWGNYIPEIHAVVKALIAVEDSDPAAASAWNDRKQAIRHGCAAAINALHKDGCLVQDYSVEEATDLLWTLLSVDNWEHLVLSCTWSQENYVARMKKMAQTVLTL